MSKHTPGPWIVKPIPNTKCWQILNPAAEEGRRFIADTTSNEANARLIAAAPEVLESLILIWNELDHHVHWKELESLHPSVRENAMKAIAKATGGTP
jgi:hypothetical protein